MINNNNNKIITESGMNFCGDNSFRIEKFLTDKLKIKNIKSVEFVRIIDDKIIFLEAKSSFPNPNSPPQDGENPANADFRKAISEIVSKFTHSLNLYSAVNMGAAGDGFPLDHEIPNKKTKIIFLLVIKNFDDCWCSNVQKTLNRQFISSVIMREIWKPDVIVMNRKKASEKNLLCHRYCDLSAS